MPSHRVLAGVCSSAMRFLDKFSNRSRELLASELLSFSIAVIILGVAGGTIRLWSLGGPVLTSALRYSVSAGGGLLICAILLSKGRVLSIRPRPTGFALALILLFFTDWLARPFSLYIGPSIRGPIILLSILAYFLWTKGLLNRVLGIFTILSSGLLCLGLIINSEGMPLFSDDHPVNIYRIKLLVENFPFIPFYSPLWNAGLDARDFFATGILNIFLLFAPLWYLFDVTSIYTGVFSFILFVILPLSTYCGARLIGNSKLAATLSALAAFAPSAFFYRWALSYGTTGFIVSASLLPLNCALMAVVLRSGSAVSNKHLIWTFCLLSISLLWSPIGLVFLPATLFLVPKLREFVSSKRLVLTGLLFLALHLPWIALFLTVSKVTGYVSLSRNNVAPETLKLEDLANTKAGTSSSPADSVEMRPAISVDNSQTGSGSTVVTGTQAKPAPRSFAQATVKHYKHSFSLQGILAAFREFAAKANPLYLLLIIPGVAMLSQRYYRYWYAALLAWLCFLGLVVAPFRPQLELERMLLVALIVGAVPLGRAIERVASNKRAFSQMLFAFLVGWILTGPFVVSNIINNRSYERFFFESSRAAELATVIEKNSGPGRVTFLGFILHHLDNGHIAPLALWANKPLVAQSPFHNLWWYTELVSRSFLKRGEAGIEEYLDLFYTTAVVAHEPKWIQYLNERPDRYKKIWNAGLFHFFRRTPTPGSEGYFLEGQGEVLQQDSSSATIRVDSSESVIKFKYFPFVTAEPCQVEPYHLPDDLMLIRLKGCPVGATVKLQAKTGFWRLSKRYQ